MIAVVLLGFPLFFYWNIVSFISYSIKEGGFATAQFLIGLELMHKFGKVQHTEWGKMITGKVLLYKVYGKGKTHAGIL